MDAGALARTGRRDVEVKQENRSLYLWQAGNTAQQGGINRVAQC
jgi:hypothetical protein